MKRRTATAPPGAGSGSMSPRPPACRRCEEEVRETGRIRVGSGNRMRQGQASGWSEPEGLELTAFRAPRQLHKRCLLEHLLLRYKGPRGRSGAEPHGEPGRGGCRRSGFAGLATGAALSKPGSDARCSRLATARMPAFAGSFCIQAGSGRSSPSAWGRPYGERAPFGSKDSQPLARRMNQCPCPTTRPPATAPARHALGFWRHSALMSACLAARSAC